MVLRYPKYYEKFSCIAGDCEDTCCAGWEIDIDDKSYEYYMSIPGEFGDRIRKYIKEYPVDGEDVYETHGFILQEKKRCPFLNENNLCDMILALGEDAICDVCTYTPRNFLEYGNAREISISPSCAEAGRLIFGNREKVVFVEKETEETLAFEESEEDLLLADIILCARNRAIAILQNRSDNIDFRLCEFLHFAQTVQQHLNVSAYEEVRQLSKQWDTAEYHKIVKEKAEDSKRADKQKEQYTCFRRRMESFRGMESINEEWQQYLSSMQAHFLEAADGRKIYQKMFTDFTEYIRKENREYEYEQLAVYYAFLSLSRCVDDLNFWGKAQFVAAAFLIIRDMDIERFYEKNGVYLAEDRVDIARIYAKEVEHSEENLEYLYDEFLFEEIYQLDALCCQIMQDPFIMQDEKL